MLADDFVDLVACGATGDGGNGSRVDGGLKGEVCEQSVGGRGED